MFAKKSISQMFSCLLVFMFLFVGVLPVQAETFSCPTYASGDFLWAKSMGGEYDDQGLDIISDSNGNTYITGIFYGTTDLDPGPGIQNFTSMGNSDNFVSKFDRNGNLIWVKTWGGTDYDVSWKVAVDSNGNVYAIGGFYSTADFDPGTGVFNLTSAGKRDGFMSKLDSSGNFVLAKQWGGTGDDSPLNITLDSINNIYVTGYFEGTLDFDLGTGIYNLSSLGHDDVFVSKLDSNGNLIWAKQMGGTTNLGWAIGTGIAIDANNNVYATGEFDHTADFDPGSGTANLTATGLTDIFISKLDNNGDFVWTKRMGGTADSYSRRIAVDSNGNIYTTGHFQDGTIDFDPGSGTVNLSAVGSSDIFISKLDSNGNYVWAKSIGGLGAEQGNGIAIDLSNNVYITGAFGYFSVPSYSVDFDPGPGITNLTASGSAAFITRLDSNGNLVWAKGWGGVGKAMSLTLDGYIYATGSFTGTSDFDPGSGIANLTATGGGVTADIFISKLETDVTAYKLFLPLILR